MGFGSFISKGLGAATGGLVGEDVFGLDITGAGAAAEAATSGARSAAEAQIASTEKNIEFQKWLWGEQKELQQPYAEMGAGAIGQYQEMAGTPMSIEDVYADPGYQFGLSEGQRARETSGAAKGMQLSGAQQKAMTRYGTDYASTKYGEAFNRRQANLDNLYRMINTGQASAAGQAAAGSQMGTQVGASIGQAGAAEAQMYSDIGNIQAAGAMSGFNTLMDVGNLAAQFIPK